MKPSERRALKQKMKEQEIREYEVFDPAPQDAEGERVNENTEKNNTGVVHRVTEFIQSHVRLITFVVCMVLMLTVLGPWGIDMLVEKRNNKTVLGKNDISLETVYTLSENAEVVRWSHLKNYNYTDYSYEGKNGVKYNVREYPIADSGLSLKAGGYDLTRAPDYIYLIDYKSGEYIDILKESARAFVISLEEETN